jgi:DNA polymerase-3 subunit gamma/tau
LANQGFDTTHVARDLLSTLRDLVVAKVCANPGDLLDLADEEKRDVIELAKGSDADDLLRLHQGFSQAFDDVVKSGQPRAALEMLLVRLARRPALIPIDDLVARLGTLERRLGPGARGDTRPGGGAARGGRGESRGEPPAPPEMPRSVEPPLARPREVKSDASERMPSAERDRREEPPAAPAAPVEPAKPEAKAEASTEQAVTALVTWFEILEKLAQDRPELAALLEHAAPLAVGPTEVVVGWEPGSVLASQASDKDSLSALTRAASDYFGSRVHVVFEFDSERAKGFDTLAQQQTRARKEKLRSAIAEAKRHPRVLDAMEVLGARLKDLKLASE